MFFLLTMLKIFLSKLYEEEFMPLERKFEFLKRVKMPTQKQFNKRERRGRLKRMAEHARFLACSDTDPHLKNTQRSEVF